ncbi:MAG TPA: carbamoyltransferase HypF [Terriglobales bacterium]|nr:carbamoyltransferase HypF [Terriglobales bacterium]
MDVRRQIEVSGIVQGVGFRPYIYRLATGRHLSGTIRNTSAGVTIEIQGPAETVQDFVDRLPAEAPPLARITNLAVREVPCVVVQIGGDQDFRIVHSAEGAEVRTLISPDVAICPDCLREMFDPNDRRYRYPFINCTNCGPRFTIIRDIPYDRPSTSMAVFPMCPACQAEYEAPLNRRFHAQPNACWECGPRVELWDKSGKRIECRDPIVEAVSALHAGLVVAVKGLGGFHLAADATNPEAVALLRQRKRRVEKPFAVMVPDLRAAEEICELNDAASAALQSIQRPIVLLPKKLRPDGDARLSVIPDEVAPFNRYLGIFLPYTPLHYLLLAEGGFKALVMTSGNQSEEPIAIDNREAVDRLNGLADYFLVHNRDILLRCDDSVVRVAGGVTRQLRRSRGFVPVPVFLKDDQPSVLAVGGELKNTICLTKGKHAFLSQHVGDLENAESYSFFHEAIEHLKRILEIRPEIIAYDLHPDYFSTRWALQQSGMQLVGVQHHHAHIASCMAENHLEGRVIGFALDGTGYGTDGTIWGGEVLIAGYEDFERAAHFEYVPLPGGAAAIREPWRMAVSYLAHHFGREFLKPQFLKLDIPFLRQLNRPKAELLLRMMEHGVNSPLTSSCGRLFDAVAALVGIRQQVNYEAQAAIELEMAMASSETASSEEDTAYPMKLLPELVPESGHWIISTRPLFEALLDDLGRNLPVGAISRRFHNGLVEGFVQLATLLQKKTTLNRVCLSGGTFHNIYLSERLEARLSEAGFEVFTQKEVPAGDGGLSLGQALVGAARLHA